MLIRFHTGHRHDDKGGRKRTFVRVRPSLRRRMELSARQHLSGRTADVVAGLLLRPGWTSSGRLVRLLTSVSGG